MQGATSRLRHTDALQNALLLVVLSAIAVGMLVVYYWVYRSAQVAEVAIRGLVLVVFGLAGWLPWTTYRAETASCKNVLRFLSVLVTAGLLLTVVSVGVTRTILLGCAIALCCCLLSVFVESITGRGDWLLVPVWQLVLGTSVLCFYILARVTRGETLSLGIVGGILVALGLFIFHRSFVRERENALANKDTTEG